MLLYSLYHLSLFNVRKRGLRTRVNKVMFTITMFMYLLSTAYWAYSIADVVDRMMLYVDDPQNPLDLNASHDEVSKWSPFFNAIILSNYIMSDAVVVWRAWILSLGRHRKYLCVTIGFLVLTTISVGGIIVFRVIALVQAPYFQLPSNSYLVKGINILQIAALGCSLLSNVSATAVVGATAWHHRQEIRAALSDNKKYARSRADQILSLVVESGVLYCFSGLTVLVSSLIRLPHGTLGDIYSPVNTLIAGAYPSVVILLVRMHKSLSETTFLNTFENSARSRPELMASGTTSRNQKSAPTLSIHFARNPEFSGTELWTQPEANLDSDQGHAVYGDAMDKD
ncbi:hypothetical protein DFH07DRAFT_803008 [Mycena maculata]|uniref:Uncharacterized protein n=1 Tax=Mycena maculata TaxID=230809 RepID=A0AAD7JXR9_9AGAR|nr:hypothetical protein DFH07DRAFT_803008 [Mycena maculata]